MSVCANSKLLQRDDRHKRVAFLRCKYPTWAAIKLKSMNKSNYNKKPKAQ